MFLNDLSYWSSNLDNKSHFPAGLD